MEQRARLRLFGVPTLSRGGREWALPMERRSQLIAWLALRGDWAPRAEAAALLWPGTEDRLAMANLRKTLFRLADAPWGDCIASEGSALRFDGDTDSAAFDAALHAQHLDEALTLRRGELLAGFDDPANDAWTAWLAYERERRRGAWRGAALESLAGGLPGPAALDLAARLLESDPLDDAALREQVRALAATGQRAAAREAIDRFAESLRSELQVAPDASLRALRASLGEDGAVTLADASALAPSKPATTPIAEEGFIGRSAELSRIASLLEQDDCRALCLLGPGGIGKTRLARRALKELAPGYADGAVFVSLEGVADRAGFGHALARAFELPAAGAVPDEDALAAVARQLRQRRMLLVLDNAEDLAPEAGAMQHLLDACPALQLLVTSRVRLMHIDEWSLVLEGLPCPDAEDTDRIEAFDAVRLFVRHAQRVEPGFSATADAAALVEICRLVDGLPLALELAAAWVRLMPLADIAAELRAGSDLLRAEHAGKTKRHASLDQVFEQSWRRLAASEQRSLMRLAVFQGGFGAPAARAVAGATLPVLAALIDKSLLHKDGARLRLHPLVQQLAAARLQAAERDAVAAAHAAHFIEQLVRERVALESGQRDALRRFDAEIDNARAACRWAAEHGAAAFDDGASGRAAARALADAAWAMMAYHELRGLRQEALRSARWAVGTAAARRHVPLRGVLHAINAHMAQRVGAYDEAVAQGELALATASGSGSAGRRAQQQALSTMAGCEIARGHGAAARGFFERALRIAEEGGDPVGCAVIGGNLAMAEVRLGRLAEAVVLATDALARLRRLGRDADVARLLNNLGDMQLQLEDNAAAERSLQESLQLCERLGLQGVMGLVLTNLSNGAEARGDLAGAMAYIRRALPALEQAGDRVYAAAARQSLASIELRLGHLDAAQHEIAAAMREALHVDHRLLQLYLLVQLAKLFEARAAPAAALALRRFVFGHEDANRLLHIELQPHIDAAGAAPPPAQASSSARALVLPTLAARVADEALHAALMRELGGA